MSAQGEPVSLTEESKEAKWVNLDEVNNLIKNTPEQFYTAFLAPLKKYLQKELMKQDLTSSKVECSYYRTLAYSYLCFAKAGLESFGADESETNIKFTFPPPEIQDNEKILLLPFPFYFNLFQSLELSMKGFLMLKRDCTQGELKEIAHDLHKLKEKCINAGFLFNEFDLKVIGEFHKLTKEMNHALRYPYAGDFSFPGYKFIFSLIKRLIDQLPKY